MTQEWAKITAAMKLQKVNEKYFTRYKVAQSDTPAARIVALTGADLIFCLLLAAVVLMAVLDDDDYQRLAHPPRRRRSKISLYNILINLMA